MKNILEYKLVREPNWMISFRREDVVAVSHDDTRKYTEVYLRTVEGPFLLEAPYEQVKADVFFPDGE